MTIPFWINLYSCDMFFAWLPGFFFVSTPYRGRWDFQGLLLADGIRLVSWDSRICYF
ncbi:hypothetical protein BDV32DRAFT_41530 [Aspergillus pseudonomiae]|nr:hypothetical protein BDV32DRAFT_41530 [Aspergillus pseudonomiae]